MEHRKVRHLVEKSGAAAPRYYWQPSAELRSAGWLPRRLTDAAGRPIADRMAAESAAEELNAEVDRWRRGEAPAHGTVGLRPKTAPKSVAALIDDYKASRFWTKLASSTQRDYGWALEAIKAWAGDMPARAITPPAVQAFYTAQLKRPAGKGRGKKARQTPAKAAATIRVLRLLLQVGERLGYLPAGTNPAQKPGIGVSRQRQPVIWSPEALQHMVATADQMGWRSIGTAMVLNEWLGQRQSDLLRLPPWSAGSGALVFAQGKRQRWVSLPLHVVPHLVARLEAEATRPGAILGLNHLLIHEGTKEQWNRFTFGHTFAEIRAAAAKTMPGCAQLRFMELRHTAVTRLHEAGVDDLGIGSITGHSAATVRQILERHYLVRTAKAAEGAFRKRLAAETGL